MIRGAVENAHKGLNQILVRDGASETLSPLTIMTGKPSPNYNDMKIEFGEYAQVWEEDCPTNTVKARTTGAIALTPTGNAQGGHYFLSLVMRYDSYSEYTRGKKHLYLGMNIDFHEDGTATVKMKEYIKEAIIDFGQEIIRSGTSPARRELFEINEDSRDLIEKDCEIFHSMVATLLYVSIRGRLDIILPLLSYAPESPAALSKTGQN